MAHLQDSITRLSRFWVEAGCILMPSADVEVGTGTMVPEVFLRLLGPEPWRGAHLQATRRPWDARFALNQLRLGKHFQFQVLLKPPDDEARQLFLGSLRALELDLSVHDLQFSETRWRVPSIGVDGLGWEVKLDGLEIAHLVYLQRAGGQSLDPVSLEITYGLERIAAVAQQAGTVERIEWDDGVSYAEVRQLEEADFSRYYLEVADPELLRTRLDALAEEADRCLDAGLVLPAYELILKSSHLLQVLLLRAAVSRQEESELRDRLRRLAHSCAERYLERREEAGFPLKGAFADPTEKGGDDGDG